MTDAAVLEGLFGKVRLLPDIDASSRLARLVGLDDHKKRLSAVLTLLVDPSSLEKWVGAHHKGATDLVDAVLRRPPLVVLAGDVGSGKTELAETIGDAVARAAGIEITLLPLSLSARGSGRVGEMTQLLTSAFDAAADMSRRYKGRDDKARGGVILLVDEADALAQSRESAQMHHEDRAGVNAFIRGIDQLANEKLPVAVIMCTNRLSALDPAVRRRAGDVLVFGRPTAVQREAVLTLRLAPLGFGPKAIDALVASTGERPGLAYGFTYSDLTQRLLPSIVLDAYPHGPVTPARALEVAQLLVPTPPFRDGAGDVA